MVYIYFDRSAIEILEAEIRDSIDELNLSSVDERFSDGNTLANQHPRIVSWDTIAIDISRKSDKSDTGQLNNMMDKYINFILRETPYNMRFWHW